MYTFSLMANPPVPTFTPAVPTDPLRRIIVFSLIGLALFLAWQALAMRSYIAKDTRPPAWDQAIHLDIAFDYQQALSQGRWSDALHLRPKPGMPPFPPLYHLFLMQIYDSASPPAKALWVNWFYLVLLSVALFGLAFHFRPDWTALPCTLLFLCAPGMQELYYTQLIDISLVAFATACYWALVRSEEFRDWAWSLGFGVLFAAGMLHKWSFFSYMIPAYVVALKAVDDRKRRWQALAAAGVALVLFVPWYWTHFAVLVPRLFQATSDFAVPVWRGGAFFTYFLEMSESLGPLFWILSFIGILVPQFQRAGGRGWLLTVWFLSSYVFWAIVPNRQMRFLMPGLPALAVAGMGAWPQMLIYGVAALQLFTAANYPNGWITRIGIPVPFKDMVFFVNDPAATEDWKLDAILTTAQKLHRPADHPVANITLVANHPRFNGPNFVWTSKRLKLPDVKMRGVNSRLCELSEFVLLKTGSLGPPGVISQLPEAAKLIGNARGWFMQGYESVGTWPLPDGSSAVLYQQKRLVRPPLPLSHYDFQYYESGQFTATDMKLELGTWDPVAAAYKSASLSGREAKLRGLELGTVRVEMEGLTFIPIADAGIGWQDMRILRMSKLRIASASLDSEAVRAYIQSRIKGLTLSVLDLGKTVKAEGKFKAFALSAEVAVALSSDVLHVNLLRAKLGPFIAPPSLLHGFDSFSLPLTPTTELPFRLELPGLTLANGRVSVP